MLAIALSATAFVCYGAITLFAQQEQGANAGVSQSQAKPVGRPVAIRLLSKNAKPQPKPVAAGNNVVMHGMATLPPPSGLPAEGMVMTAISVAPSNSGATANTQPPFQFPSAGPAPLPPALNVSQVPAAGSSLLPLLEASTPAPLGFTQPPKMSEVAPKPANGRVLVKLGNELPTPTGSPTVTVSGISQPTASQPSLAEGATRQNTSTSETVDIRVMPALPTSVPTALPSVLFADSPTTQGKASQVQVLEPKAPVRISLSENGTVDRIPLPSLEVKSSANHKNRVPELVKPVPTQISHTVTLVESTDLENGSAPSSDGRIPEGNQGPSVATMPVVAPALPGTKVESRTSKPSVAGSFVELAPPSTITEAPAGLPKATNAALDIGPGHAGSAKVSNAVARPKGMLPIPVTAATATVEIASQSATAMDLHGTITAVAVENEDVCRVIHNERTISIVGNTVGSSIVQIWTNEMQEVPLVVRVNVSQHLQRPSAKPNDVQEVKQAIEKAFPRAKVNIVSNDDGMIEVRGTTDTEDSAKRILEIVRKLCLVPVKDKLTVSR